MITLLHRFVGGLLAQGPTQSARGLLSSTCHRLPLPLEPDWAEGWKPYHQFRGPTRNVQELACHASVLIPGHCPHKPHAHAEEEILIMLAGAAELILPQGGADVANGSLLVGADDFVYYPAFYPHTLRATGPAPAEYLMFKWMGRKELHASPLDFLPMQTRWPDMASPSCDGYRGRGLFEGPTGYLHKLHCHTSSVEAGGGYAPHLDDHDVAIVLLEGECEILGDHVGPGSIVFCAAGEPHGLRNPGTGVARYLVFEFHGGYRLSIWERLRRRARSQH